MSRIVLGELRAANGTTLKVVRCINAPPTIEHYEVVMEDAESIVTFPSMVATEQS